MIHDSIIPLVDALSKYMEWEKEVLEPESCSSKWHFLKYIFTGFMLNIHELSLRPTNARNI